MAGLLGSMGRNDEAESKRAAASSVIDEIAAGISDAGLRSDFVGYATSKL